MTIQIWKKLYDDAFVGMDGNTPTKLLHEAFRSNAIEEQGSHSGQGILDLIISLEDIEVLVLSMSVDEKIRLLQLQAILRLILCRFPSNDRLDHFDHVFTLLDRVAILLDLRKPVSMSQDDDESPPFLSFIKDKIAPNVSASMATRILKYYEIELDDSIPNVKNAALKKVFSAPTLNPRTLATEPRSDVSTVLSFTEKLDLNDQLTGREVKKKSNVSFNTFIKREEFQ
uniref:AlNc14C618G12256 protein n=1 Tax=Albugo laibachii Nc14 TaxID=890382 RepID=F0X1G5_9STRA|nr:AlNc14C618G12256 [Albugo laibachii Nc14]|eukprot:CCA27651.1 AlNc14C618G12256 [Albugo laibachii Nc14]